MNEIEMQKVRRRVWKAVMDAGDACYENGVIFTASMAADAAANELVHAWREEVES